jgi:hypothetical protein
MRVLNASIHGGTGLSGRRVRPLGRAHLRTREGHRIILPGLGPLDINPDRADPRGPDQALPPGTFLDIRV